MKNYVTIGEDEITIYGKRYSGEIFRHFDLGTEESCYLQILSKQDDDLVIVREIRLDLNNFGEILADLKARATQAIQEFDEDECLSLSLLNDNIEALSLKLGLNLQNDNN